MDLFTGVGTEARTAYRAHIGEGRESRLFALIGYVPGFFLARGVPVVFLLLGVTTHWSAGDLHIHHMVIGVPFMLIGGALALDGLHRMIGGLAFGFGSALVLDEFALMVFVDEKAYWPIVGLFVSLTAVFVFALVLLTVYFLGRPVVGRLVANAVGMARASRGGS